MVIIGHIPYPNFNPEIHKWIYSFHIPLFFFVSGISLTFTNYSHSNLKDLFKKHALHIYIPFIIWAILLSLSNITLLTIPKILYGTHKSIGAVSNSSLWFLPVLFISIIVLDIILLLINKKHAKIIIPIFLLIFLLIGFIISSHPTTRELFFSHNPPMGIDIVPTAIFFMLSGYIFESYRKTNKLKIPSYILLLVVPLFFWLTLVFGLSNDVSYVLMAENRFGNFGYFLISAFSGIILSVIIALFIAKNMKKFSSLMMKIGSNTLLIFILHRYPLILLNDLLLLLPFTNLSNWIIIPLNIFVIVPLSLFFSVIIKKHLPALAGITNKS
ncbi:acyltransferase [Candidatus Saccharibacteria bacterium]|nr:acyltransferase [Candidatus Saccharibacteria bacterium]